VAGKGGNTDGVGVNARFLHPQALAMDGGKNLYIADTGNRLIRDIRNLVSGKTITISGTSNADGSH
jgi:hypothetical protein